jgi:hypothetical protein
MENNIQGISLEKHKEHLVYGAAYLFWGVIAYVEVYAYYEQTFQFAITLTLVSALMNIVLVASQQERFRPDVLLKID